MVAFDYTFTDREANTSALVLAPMQALEGCKDSLRIRLRETEPLSKPRTSIRSFPAQRKHELGATRLSGDT